jgi:hypothetical protein
MRAHLALIGMAALLGATLAAPAAQALPMFARKYKMDCSRCHAPAVPRLNDVGYKFRRAGFRMPEQIGEEEVADFTLGDYFAGRIQSDYRVSRQPAEGGSEAAGSQKVTESRFEGQELTLYPVTGSFGRYFASRTEIGFAPGETPEIENAFIRAVWGNQDRWLQSRFGLFHPIEGFGASDSPIGITGPLFESLTAAQGQDTFIQVRQHDRVGLEVGAQWRNTSLNIALLNQLQIGTEMGELGASGTGASAFNRKDVLVSANQIIRSRGGIGAYWAHGSIHLPVDPAAFAAGNATDTWRDDYDRFALYATVGIGRFNGLAGGALGIDHDRDPTTGALSHFRSGGAFVQGDASIGAHVAPYVRLDYFDRSWSRKGDDVGALTIGSSIFTSVLFIIPELRFSREPLGDAGENAISFTIRAAATY